ncbi:MAG: trypsin-like peptidase domain-containing protein [Ruminococcaceae bacterium]|nr:trypsin-like peptidase domain-containing protein [Oscillospiraceae bacterium]
MKKLLKNLVIFICISTLLLSQLYIATADNDEKLYEIYELQEDYEYKDEIIGYALKTAVPKIVLTYSASLEYIRYTFDDDKYDEDYEKLLLDSSDQYTDDEITEYLNNYVRENPEKYICELNTNKISLSPLQAVGSGVVIDDQGYIATNAHVIQLSEDDKEMFKYDYLIDVIHNNSESLNQEFSSRGIPLETYELYDLLYEKIINNAKYVDEETKIEVCFPAADGNTHYDKANKYKAKVKSEGTQEGVDGLTQDTAILKIDEENLVALKLSETYPELNSKIVSAGYPVASDKLFQELANSMQSVLSVTVTSGQIQRIVSLANSDYKSIEISSTISGGNSGGPSVDTHLEIEGLNTYSLAADNRYAYMISAEYVSVLADEYNVEQGEASKTFLLGLQCLQDGYGKTAVECFERVKEIRNDTPFIEELIKTAKNAPDEEAPKIEKEEEKKNENSNEKEEKPFLSTTTIIIIVCVAVAIILTITLVIIITKSRKKKKSIPAKDISYSSTTEPEILPESEYTKAYSIKTSTPPTYDKPVTSSISVKTTEKAVSQNSISNAENIENTMKHMPVTPNIQENIEKQSTNISSVSNSLRSTFNKSNNINSTEDTNTTVVEQPKEAQPKSRLIMSKNLEDKSEN